MHAKIPIRSLFRGALLSPFAALVLTACSNPAESNRPTPNLTGTWDFSAAVTEAATGVVCSDTGTFTFVQVDSAVIGRSEFSRTCSDIGQYNVKDSVHAGIVSHNNLNFAQRFPYAVVTACYDSAVISGANSEILSGSGKCGTATKSWKAKRGEAVASISISPAGATTIKGGVIGFAAITKNAAGARILSRPITWSSGNSAVVTVDTSGQATAVAPGTTTIIASSETVTASASFTVSSNLALQNVSSGNASTCALDANGVAYCWGHALTSAPLAKIPVAVAGTIHFASVSVGDDFACGVSLTNSPYCWGKNDIGQLGNGLQNSSMVLQPTLVSGSLQLSSISVGLTHVCGLTVSGTAYCWGDNRNGQLGNASNVSSNVPVAVGGGVAFRAISVGGRHSCGIALDGTLYCWGANDGGQIGDGTLTQRNVPTAVQSALHWSAVSVARNSTCALATNGDAYCWGKNDSGQLGNGSHADQIAPNKIINGVAFTSITVGHNHACAITQSGAAYCWGTNSWGQLGNGNNTASLAPVQVSGGLIFKSISSGYYTFSDEAINEGTAEHTCAVTTANVTYCWGVNLVGQLGIGAPQRTSVSVPTKVAGQP